VKPEATRDRKEGKKTTKPKEGARVPVRAKEKRQGASPQLGVQLKKNPAHAKVV